MACGILSSRFSHARGACSAAHGGMRNPQFSLPACQRSLFCRPRRHAESSVFTSRMPGELALPPSAACETVSFHFSHAGEACSAARGGMRNCQFSLLACRRSLHCRPRRHAKPSVFASRMPGELALPPVAACGILSFHFPHTGEACSAVLGDMRNRQFSLPACQRSLLGRPRWHAKPSVFASRMSEELALPPAAACGILSFHFSHAKGAKAAADKCLVKPQQFRFPRFYSQQFRFPRFYSQQFRFSP